MRELQITDTDNNLSEYFGRTFIKAGRIRMPACAADFTSLRFSTRGLPERMRIPMWREEFGRCIVHVDMEPSSDVPFQVEATLQALQDLRTLAWQGSAMRFKRSKANIVDGDDSIGIIVCSLPGGVSYRSAAKRSSFAPAMQSRFCIRNPRLSPMQKDCSLVCPCRATR